MIEDSPKEKKSAAPTVKLPYLPPKLIELGTVGDLTRAVGKFGSSDGATMGANRTSV